MARRLAVVLGGPPAFSLAVADLWVALGGGWGEAAPPPLIAGIDGGPLPVSMLLLYFVALAATDGPGEETGWHGFALPQLLTHRSLVSVSLLLGIVRAAWHLPLVWTAGSPLEGRSIPLLLLQLPALSVLYTWVFQHTRGSLLMAILFHASGNLWGVAALPAPGHEVTPALLRTGAMWLLALGAMSMLRTLPMPTVTMPNHRLNSTAEL